MSESRYFDLNIQRVLEHWTVSEALREIIANAHDERALTATGEPEIFEDEAGAWHVRDFGRGLRYEHFTQNENPEKLQNPELVIGKFGVGLKDALATLDRHRVGVLIRSQHADIATESVGKHGFDDVRTLHAVVSDPSDPNMAGTEFVLSGLTRLDVERAKEFFLCYSGDLELEKTGYGSVLKRGEGLARIYVNGLRVAEEPNFLFGYNITSLTKSLRAALNRERSNVGRQAYSDRVKAILLASTSSVVADMLAGDLAKFSDGTDHDETKWIDVALHACQILNANEQVVFVTSDQVYADAGLLTRARGDGYRPVVIPWTVASKLSDLSDLQGNPMRDLNEYRDQWNQSFEYDFVDVADLTDAERSVYDLSAAILEIVSNEAHRVREILISQTMRISTYNNNEAAGVWEPPTGRIVIKRSQLADPHLFIGTLLHEIAHAFSGAADVTENFENGLTHLLGGVGTVAAAGHA